MRPSPRTARSLRDLRVAVNLTWIAPGRVGGSEEYLVRQLLGLPSDAVRRRDCSATPALAAAPPRRSPRGVRSQPTPLGRDNRAVRIVLEHIWLAVMRPRHCDVVHHGGGTVPADRTSARSVLTVHDLQYLHFPEYFSGSGVRYLDAMVPRSVRRASVIATPSEFVRGDGARRVRMPIRCVSSSFRTASRRPRSTVRTTRSCAVRARSWPRRSSLCRSIPAITHPHKGHVVLVEHARSPSTTTRTWCCSGGRAAAEADARGRDCRQSPGRTGSCRPGRVPDAERDALIAGADVLVFPSQYEGFGAPLVEAMAFGVPVVCCDHPAIREVVGDAGVIVGLGLSIQAPPLHGPERVDEAGVVAPNWWHSGVDAAGVHARDVWPRPRRRLPTRRRCGPASMKIRRAVSALRARYRSDRHGDDPDRPGTR